MLKMTPLSWSILLAVLFSGCSAGATRSTDTLTTPTSQPGSTISASTEEIGEPNIVGTAQIPVTWADLGLTGRLVYINGLSVDNVFRLQIQILDLGTGEVTTIFDAPKYSWIYYISISPDHRQLLMSYSPPPGDHPVDQDIYVMPLDGSRAPERLFIPPTREDDYIEVEWAPDGRAIYLTHVNYQIPPAEGQIHPLYTIYRMAMPAGQLEKLVEKAYWPRVSSDSSRITYVSVDLFSQQNRLLVANADGSNPREVVISGPRIPDIKDAPLFSADGQSLIFSADIPTQSLQPNWLDRLMGVQLARAHGDILSDWWMVPMAGGLMTRLTNIQSRGLFGSLSPDKQYLASYSLDGIFVVKTDGTRLTKLLPNPQSVPGTVSWIP